MAEAQDAMLLHFSQNMLRVIVVTKSGLGVYAQDALSWSTPLSCCVLCAI